MRHFLRVLTKHRGHRVAPHVLKQPNKSTIGALERPSLVHRLDAPTSGCLVLAKTRRAAINLSEQFASRKVKKVYIALLQGGLTEKHGCIDSPIDEKPAVTEWKVIRHIPSTKSPLTLVEFRPRHGRKHQLRRHAVCILTMCKNYCFVVEYSYQYFPFASPRCSSVQLLVTTCMEAQSERSYSCVLQRFNYTIQLTKTRL